MSDPLYTLEYVSPRGDRITFSPWHIEGPYLLMGTSGLSSSKAEPVTRKGVGQPGGTLVAIGVQPKVVTCSLAVLARNEAEYWTRRQVLVDALNMQVNTLSPVPGTLVIKRQSKPDLQLRVVPQLSPIEVGRPDSLSVLMDVEFFAPLPYFQAITPLSAILEGEGGFEFPLEHEWESGANRADQELNNPGTVQSPITAVLHGEFTNGRLINQTTGEILEYLGTVNAGDRVRITTAYGDKRVTHITSSGVETNVMGNLDLSESVFWSLLRGTNEVIFEADDNPSGYAVITWRPQYGGL